MVLSTGGSPVPTPADSEEASFPHYIIGRLQRHVVLLAFCIRVMASGRIIKGWSRLQSLPLSRFPPFKVKIMFGNNARLLLKC